MLWLALAKRERVISPSRIALGRPRLVRVVEEPLPVVEQDLAVIVDDEERVEALVAIGRRSGPSRRFLVRR